MKKIVVIGSGIAGLAAAKHFNSINFNITVLDKGKYPGGRISTRKNKKFIFNHGAQFFTAKSNEFKKICQLGVKDNVLINWNTLSKKDKFIGNPDMREFSYWFSKNLEIYQETLVESIEYKDTFTIITNNKKISLSTISNFHNGATISNVPLNTVHPDNLQMFKRVNQLLDKNISGIDFISNNLSIPFYQLGAVIEVNSRPDIVIHTYIDICMHI